MRFLRPGWLIIYVLVLCWFFLRSTTISFEGSLEVKKGDTFSSIVSEHFSGIEKYSLKRRLRSHTAQLPKLQPGLYNFTGELSRNDFFATLGQGPKNDYQRVTILEGWSSYDIDDALTKQGYIKAGAYVNYVTSGALLRDLTNKYPFLGGITRGELKPLTTLEGFLYPDTYNIDRSKAFLPQLVSLQLKQFGAIVREPLESQIRAYPATLRTMGRDNLELNRYNILILATIIEKEERSNKNRPLIAGIFLNRLASKMRIDADISLCYGLHQGYENCPPSVIIQHLEDSSNPYNTRAVMGLPPTPIANPQLSSIKAVLEPMVTKDLFYLHDKRGYIYTATTNAEHELNKSKYLP